MKYKIAVNDRTFEVEINDIKEGIAQVNVDGRPYDVLIENYEDIAAGSKNLSPALSRAAAPAPGTIPSSSTKPAPVSPKMSTPATDTVAVPAKPATPTPAPAPKKVQAAGEIVAPIPGRILDIKVNVGDPVAKGQTLAIMEAMKMENNITSTMDGVVQTIRVQKNSEVATGEVIMIIE
jgi:glutaconyl-CoA/methylmalonyl-CoA decarboxylase subunit gamma